MGGLWVDYDLMSNVPGLYVLGEANFSDHGANRLGASALMQGLADGYFVLPATISDYLAPRLGEKLVGADDPAFREAENAVNEQTRRLTSINGSRSVDHFHRELGNVLWDYCGMARSRETLEKALAEIPALRNEFYADVKVLGGDESLNQSLEKAGRVADFLEFGELLCYDALQREESCGGHFRAGAPDRRRRGAPRRRELLVRRGVGVHRRRLAAGAPQGTRSSSSTSTSPSATTRKETALVWI